MADRPPAVFVPLQMPTLPAKSVDTLARIIGHMACGESVEINLRLHHGGVRVYRETTTPLDQSPNNPKPEIL